jgi:hypothetical protein
MTGLANTAEGGSNGTAVTPANSGGASGTAFASVNVGAGSSIKFDSTQQAHGALSYHLVQAATNCYVEMTAAAANVSMAARVYIRFNTLPTPNGQAFLQIVGGGAYIGRRPTNQFSIEDQSGSRKVFAGTMAVGTWYRLEVETISAGIGASYLAGRYFLGDSTTPVDSYSSSTANTGGTANSAVRFGPQVNLSANNDLWIDDLSINNGTTTPIGPAAVAATGTAAMALAATGTAVPAAVFAGWGIPL